MSKLDFHLGRIAIIVTLVALVIGIFVMQSFNEKIEEQDTKSLVNRALNCEMLGIIAGREALPEQCVQKGVLKFYDPDRLPPTLARSSSEQNLVVMCRFLQSQGSSLSSEEPCSSALQGN